MTIISLVLISVSAMSFILSFQKNSEFWSRLGLVSGLSAAILLLIEIITGLSLYGALVSTSVILACVITWMTIIGQVFFQMKLAGIMTLPLSMLMLLLDLFNGPPNFVKPVESGAHLFRDIHIITANLGQAMAIGAFSISVMYLWQRKNLKEKVLNQVTDKVPALDRLSILLNRSIWLGLIFLTVALISGAFYVSRSIVAYGLEYKVLWAIGVWVWYLSILILKNVFNKPTHYVSKLCVIGFFILAISFFGVFLKPVVGV